MATQREMKGTSPDTATPSKSLSALISAEPVTTDNRRVIAIQQGARRNYIYARQLEAAGLLNYLACDSAWAADQPHWLDGLDWKFAAAVRRRTIVGVPPRRICTSWWPNAVAPLRLIAERERVFEWMDAALALRLRLRGLKGTEVIVNYLGNGGSFLTFAKRRGVKIITDFIISPRGIEEERQERQAWPAWDKRRISRVSMTIHRRRFLWLLQISDIYMCPSMSVAEDLSALPGFDSSRVRIVPYGRSGALVRQPQPESGRVLFAGTEALRKGLPYLAQAATQLNARALPVKIVVAGDIPASIHQLPEARNLIFLGHLNPQEMAREFARADVFCLPSLAEGSATVIYEALAHGLPVVTTHASGSIVRDGIEGTIVPPRDGDAIAAAITEIVTDPIRRARLSKAAAAAAMFYDEERCGAKFLNVVRECMVGKFNTRFV